MEPKFALLKKVGSRGAVGVLTAAVFAAAGIIAGPMSVAGPSGMYAPACGQYYYGIYDGVYTGVYTYNNATGVYTRVSGHRTLAQLCGASTPYVPAPPGGGDTGGGDTGGGGVLPTDPGTTDPGNDPAAPGTVTKTVGNNEVRFTLPAGVAADNVQVGGVLPSRTTEMVRDIQAAVKGVSQAQVRVTAAAPAFTLNVSGEGAFATPIKTEIALNEGVDAELVKVFYVDADGNLVPLRTKVSGDGTVTFGAIGNGTYVIGEVNKTFTDVGDHWAARNIKVMSAQLAIDGYPDGSFQPQGDVTRAEFVAMLVRALELKATGSAGFADVASDAWYAGVVAAAVEAGLVNGVDANSFDPNGKITREQMMTILGRAATQFDLGGQPANLGNYADLSELSDWAREATGLAVGNELIQGMESNGTWTLAPKSNATRGEAATILYRLFNKVD